MHYRQSDNHHNHDKGEGISITVATFFVLFQFFFVA